MNLEYIKNKLLNYGLNLENYLYQTGNLIGKLNVPTQLLSYNKNMTAEEAFYLVANKVFELANLLAYNVPVSLNEEYKNIVGPDIYRDFQKAIYEEINQRFLSNTFPEFANSGQMSLSNTNFNPGISGGPSINEWVNPVSKQIIANIPWRDFANNAELLKYKAFMYRNMENASFPNAHEKRLLQVLEDGSVALENKSFFATANSLENTNNDIQALRTNQNSNINDINEIKTKIPNLASIEYVNELITKFPKTKKYDPDKEYSHGDFVVFFKKIYFSLENNNLNNTPGGITGQGWWEEIADVFIPNQETSIIYAAGTDVKQCLKNPNELFYVSLNEINEIENLDQSKLFSFLNKKFNHLNLTQNDANILWNNLSDSNLKKFKFQYFRTAFKKGQILFFENLNRFNEWKSEYEFLDIENKFKFLENGRYLMIGEFGVIGGNNIIQMENLPKKDFGLEIKQLSGNNNSVDRIACGRWDASTSFNCAPDIALKGGGSSWYNSVNNGYVTDITWSYGVLNREEFKPKFQEILGIKFLEDVHDTSINYFVNVIDLTISGTIQKTQNTAQTNYSLNNEKNIIYEDNKNRKKFK